MKKLMLISLIALIGGGLLVSSCNKNETAEPNVISSSSRTTTKDLSSIPWDNYFWPAVHRVGGIDPAGPIDGPHKFPGLNASDYIVHKCGQDENFIPKNGHFKEETIKLFYFTAEEIAQMVEFDFYWKIIGGESSIQIPEYHPTSFYDIYVSKVKERVNEKLNGFGMPELRVESIIFESEKIRYPINYWEAPLGNYLGLGGFTFGIWIEN